MSYKRKKLSKKSSKKMFTKHAKKSNGRNFQGAPMRGGIRL